MGVTRIRSPAVMGRFLTFSVAGRGYLSVGSAAQQISIVMKLEHGDPAHRSCCS